jgi:hypothetical protein
MTRTAAHAEARKALGRPLTEVETELFDSLISGFQRVSEPMRPFMVALAHNTIDAYEAGHHAGMREVIRAIPERTDRR